MKKLDREAQDYIIKNMTGLTGQACRAEAARLAKHFDISIDRIYAVSRDVRPKRQARADKNTMRVVDEKQFMLLAALTVKADYAATHVIDVARGNGLPELSASTFNRHLRRNRIDRKTNKVDLLPYKSWHAKHPNDIHQIDSTVAEQFYIDDDESIGYEAIKRRYKNKQGNRKPRLVLLGLVDDCSRVRCARFMLGNDTRAWMDFLFWAWSQKSDPAAFPFHGLPRVLYSDNDAVMKSDKMRFALEKLDVTSVKHFPENPRAKGKVENSFKIMQEFQKQTKIQTFKSLAEANEALEDFLIGLNSRPHSATKRLPFEHWLNVQNSKLMRAPDKDIYDLLHLNSRMCKINPDMSFKLLGENWYLPFTNQDLVNKIGQMVSVYWPDSAERCFIVLENKEYEIARLNVREQVGPRSEELPKPAALQLREELEKEEISLRLNGFYKELYGRKYLPKRGQEFDKTKVRPDIQQIQLMRNKTWLTKELQRRDLIHTPPSAIDKQRIDGIFGEAKELSEEYLNEKLANWQTTAAIKKAV